MWLREEVIHPGLPKTALDGDGGNDVLRQVLLKVKNFRDYLCVKII